MNVGLKLTVCPKIILAPGNLESPAMKHIYTTNLMYMSHVSILICEVCVRVLNFVDWHVSINNDSKLSDKTSVMRYSQRSKNGGGGGIDKHNGDVLRSRKYIYPTAAGCKLKAGDYPPNLHHL
jgi:hypothetical protein